MHCCGNDFRHGRTAHPALAGAHTAAGGDLDFVDVANPLANHLPHIADGHILAPAEQRIVAETVALQGRGEHLVDEGAGKTVLAQEIPQRCGEAVALVFRQYPQAAANLQGGQFPLVLGGKGTPDHGRVTGGEDVGMIGPSPPVAGRIPVALA